MKKILLTLFFCLFSLNAYAQDFGDFAPNKATRIKVINFDSYFDVASPPTVQNSLEQISASYPIVTSGLTVYGDLLPDNDNTRDIGSVDLTWNEIFGRTYMASDVIVNNTASAPIVDTQYLENSRDGAVSFRDDIIFPLTGSSIGTTNYGWLFDETNGDITTTAKVGIGTTSPSAMLDIETADPSASGDQYLEFYHSDIKRWRFYGTGPNDEDLTIGEGGTPDSVITFDDGGNVGIGTTSPRSLLEISSADTSLRLVETDVNSDGVELLPHQGDDTHGFSIYYSSDYHFSMDVDGNVGIGTTTPMALLDVVKSNDASQIFIDTYDDGTTASQIYLRKSDTDTKGTLATTDDGDTLGWIIFRGVDSGSNEDYGAYIQAVQDGAAGTRVPTELRFVTYDSTTARTDQLTLQSDGDVIMNNGNVGIGTAAPGVILDVVETASNQATIRLTSPESEDSVIRFQGDLTGTEYDVGRIDAADEDIFGIRAVGSSPGIAMDSSGNVGIGTTPSYLLDVAGNSRLQECVIFGSEEGAPCIDGDIFSTTYGRLYITPSAGNRAMSSFYYPSGTNDEAVIQINNSSDISNRGRLNCWIHGVYAKVVTDKVGAGGTAPQYLIFGEESTANSLSDIYFRFNGTDSVTIQDPGDVGIGILNPTEALTIGNAGKLQINSAGDDKYVQMYHDDVDANIDVTSGELNLSATVFDFDSNSNSQNIYIRGLDAGTEWANLFVNANDDFNISVNGGKTILDSNSDTECLRLVGADSANDYADIYVDADSILRIAPNAGGVVFQHKIVQSGANATAVGPTDNFDVSGVNLVYVNTNANNVTIGGFVGGYDGQVIHVFVVDASNNAILEHNEGTANQNIFLNSGADETLTASYGGWTLVCDGVAWFEVDN